MACYYEMAVRKRAQTKIKPSLLAKLAMHTGLMYKKAVEFTQSPALKEQLDASWGVQVKFQVSHIFLCVYSFFFLKTFS